MREIKLRVSILFVCLLITAAGARSQTILSVTTATALPVVEIDPSTGVVRTILSTGFSGGVRFQVSAFDPLRHRLFFLGDLGGSSQLVTVDLNTGTTTARPIPVSGIYLFFEYDASSNRILAATTAAGIPVVSIDPINGNVQPLITTGLSGVRFEVSSYDVARRRLFLLSETGGESQLIVVDLLHSSVTVQPLHTPDSFLFFEYDPLTDRVLAATTAPGVPIVSINPSTGAVQPLVTTGFTGGVRFEVSAFDSLRRRLFLLGDSGGTPQLIAVDLGNNSVDVRPIPTAGMYLFFQFAPASVDIPALSPASLLLLAIALAAVSIVAIARAA